MSIDVSPKTPIPENLSTIMHKFNDAQDTIFSIVIDNDTLPLSSVVVNTKSQLAYWVSGFSVRPTESPYQTLIQENAMLRLECDKLSVMLNDIVQRLRLLENIPSEEEIVILREISREDAKSEIGALFSLGEVKYYSDVARELRLDLELVVDLCNELISEGEIEVAESNP